MLLGEDDWNNLQHNFSGHVMPTDAGVSIT